VAAAGSVQLGLLMTAVMALSARWLLTAAPLPPNAAQVQTAAAAAAAAAVTVLEPAWQGLLAVPHPVSLAASA